jgi:hypothetical protein
MSDKKVESLGEFTECVKQIRKDWDVPNHKELWFRGEPEEYKTRLQPKLYRRAEPVQELLDRENFLYEYFQRCGAPLCDTTLEQGSQAWDWYFLMQHHGAPTRLLD